MGLKNRPTRQLERNKQIVELRAAGFSYRALAEDFGLSVCRIRQILEAWEGRDDLIQGDNSKALQ